MIRQPGGLAAGGAARVSVSSVACWCATPGCVFRAGSVLRLRREPALNQAGRGLGVADAALAPASEGILDAQHVAAPARLRDQPRLHARRPYSVHALAVVETSWSRRIARTGSTMRGAPSTVADGGQVAALARPWASKHESPMVVAVTIALKALVGARRRSPLRTTLHCRACRWGWPAPTRVCRCAPILVKELHSVGHSDSTP